MSATLQDVADAAGLHKTTVSRALRNDPKLAQKTRDLVHEVAKRLGYAPNPMISALMESRRHTGRAGATTIAFLTAGANAHADVWFDQFARAVHTHAEKLGFKAEEINLVEYGWNPEKALKVLYNRSCAGVLWLTGEDQCNLQAYPLISQFAVITIGNRLNDFSSVSDDPFQNAQMAYEHALKLGYKRPGLILCGGATTFTLERAGGGWLYMTRSLPKKELVPMLAFPQGKDVEKWVKQYRPDVIISNEPEKFPQLPGLTMDWVAALHGGKNPKPGIDVQRPLWGKVAVDLLASHIYHNERGAGDHARHIYVPGKWVDSGKAL